MSLPHPIPPLLGKDGVYKIKVVGNSGTGKSTISAELSEILGVPWVNLDQVHWKPQWTEASTEEFQETLQARLDAAPGGWIVDGNYTEKSGMAEEQATDILWLDPPLALYFPLLLKRTFWRLLGIGEQCSPGCEESIREVFFSKESIILWCLTYHFEARRRNTPLAESQGVEVGGKWRRIGGWGYYSSVAKWLEEIRASRKSV